MAYAACEQPAADRLAINEPGLPMLPYIYLLEEQAAHWASIQDQAASSIDIPREVMAGTLYRSIAGCLGLLTEPCLHERPDLFKIVRDTAIGTMALSRLIQQVIKPATVLKDGAGNPEMTEDDDLLIIDTMCDDAGMPLDRRLHVSTCDADKLLGTSAGNPDAWYFDDSSQLYVHRVTPIQPSPHTAEKYESGNRAREFGSLQTLFPFIATVSIAAA